MNMKNIVLAFLCFFTFFTNAQDDTLLFNDFSIDLYSVEDSLFDYEATNTINLTAQGWDIYSDNFAPISPYVINAIVDYQYYDPLIFRNWHIASYLLSTDTIAENDSTYIKQNFNNGLRSFSWVTPSDSVLNILLSPNVWIGGDSSRVRWKSMPMQGPRHQDGYQVYIIKGGGKEPLTLPLENLEPDFVMKRMSVVNGYPDTTNTSFAYLEKNFGFHPENGVMHTEYIPRETENFGEFDSAYQYPLMQEFELDLSHIENQFIQVAFVHNSYDNVGIVLDDILILGTGKVNTHDLQSNAVGLFPNPTKNVLNIELGNDVPVFVKVFSLNGQFIESILLDGSHNINVSRYKPGYYLMEIKGEKGYYSTRFIKKK